MKLEDINSFQNAELLSRSFGYMPDFGVSDTEKLADPLFWMNLGKGMGWENRKACPIHGEGHKAMDRYICKGADYRCVIYYFIELWQYRQHQYVSWIQKGETKETFFDKHFYESYR